ncbi:MAG: methionyl-tRNA formyltransferase [Chloroflexi bacterium]|nr:methionyl-tRNA formyltransferase [Chloroflexota bacterium]
MGTPEFAVPPLERLLLSKYEVVAVYTQPDRPSGRGLAPVPSPVKIAALAAGLPVVQPAKLKSPEAVDQLKALQPDVIVVAAFGQILPQSVLDIPRYGCINIHPSLLPKHRGASPVAAAILAGDEFTGVSIMLLDKGMDTGPVLALAQVPVAGQDTTGTLTAKLSLVGAWMLPDVLVRWTRGALSPRPQDDSKATYSVPLNKEEGEIDWRLPAVVLWRRVRAFQPWPGCYTRWQGKQLKIIEVVPLPGEQGAEPGTVIAVAPVRRHTEVAFGVATGDGVMGISQVQLEGKRAMSAAEFQRGQRQILSAVLPS